jgi:hypothetical protein
VDWFGFSCSEGTTCSPTLRPSSLPCEAPDVTRVA